jgi:hypothetical protein
VTKNSFYIKHHSPRVRSAPRPLRSSKASVRLQGQHSSFSICQLPVLPTTWVANYLGCQQPVLPTTHDRCLVRWSHYEKTNLLTVLTGPDVETGKYPKRNDLCKGKPSRKPYPPLESRFAMFLPRGFSAVKLGPQSPLGLTQCIATIGPIPDWPRIPLANKKSSLQPIPPCIDPIRLGFRGSAIFY